MVALSGLAGAWDKLSAQDLAVRLVEALAANLNADIVYVRIKAAGDEVIEAFDTSEAGFSPEQAAEICAAFAPSAVASTPGPLPAVHGILGANDLHGTAAPITFDGGQGAVIAAAVRSDFPTRGERVLLSFAANQAAIAFDRRRAEDERQQALHDRDRAVAALSQALRTTEEFLSTTAHDLRSPVAGVKGMAQVLKRRIDRNQANGEVIAQGLEDIDRSAGRMEDLIDELLNLARLQSERPLALHLEKGDLVAMAAEAVRMRGSLSRVHQVRFDTKLAELSGSWDRVRLLRVLNNLLDNAIKYSPKGGEIVVTVGREDGCAVLSVRDFGIGIPPQDLPHLFERFYRGINAAGVAPGTGIGLTGARHIVESHGGTIQVESVEGKGSTFTVRLPVT